MSTIAQQIRGLDGMTVAQLADRYRELHGEEPRVRNRAFLLRRVAWKLQEREFGGLSDRANARLDDLIAEIDLPLGAATPGRVRKPSRREARAPLVGTTLIRQYRGMEIRVEVVDGGYEWNGVVYGSLSAVAGAVTGAHWNGRLFFGITKRRSAT